jgi:hypothetical protein
MMVLLLIYIVHLHNYTSRSASRAGSASRKSTLVDFERERKIRFCI